MRKILLLNVHLYRNISYPDEIFENIHINASSIFELVFLNTTVKEHFLQILEGVRFLWIKRIQILTSYKCFHIDIEITSICTFRTSKSMVIIYLIRSLFKFYLMCVKSGKKLNYFNADIDYSFSLGLRIMTLHIVLSCFLWFFEYLT